MKNIKSTVDIKEIKQNTYQITVYELKHNYIIDKIDDIFH